MSQTIHKVTMLLTDADKAALQAVIKDLYRTWTPATHTLLDEMVRAASHSEVYVKPGMLDGLDEDADEQA